MVGDVDAGKSTILGRLLVDLGEVTPEKLAELESTSARRGVPIEYSFLLDAFQVERDQAITLDVTRIWLRRPDRDFVFVDAPGHRELIRNLLSGASEVDAAVMVVAADEGITYQTRRQALFLRWFGFKTVLVALNKLDLAGDPQQAFEARRADVETFLEQAGMKASAVIPIAARTGENIARRSDAYSWWSGPTLLEALERIAPHTPPVDAPLRFVVQDVYRRDGTRLVAGRVDSGILRTGDRIVFWPLQTTARVKRISLWPSEYQEAGAGRCVAIELDERIFVDRGAVATLAGDQPSLGHAMQAEIVWLSQQPLEAGSALRMRIGTREVPVSIQRVNEVIDPETVEPVQREHVGAGDVAVVTLTAHEMIAGDDEAIGSSIGRFILVRDLAVVAGGRVRSVIGRPRSQGATDVIAQKSSVTAGERARRNGHAGGVFWLTGLPRAGKSTIAMAVQRMLFDRGRQCFVLDGETLRTSLNIDLGFSDDDRTENVRRAASVAALLAEAGHVVLCAFISPFAADRLRARAAYPERFFEIYVACDLETAESRDASGLYRRARTGEIAHFTGVSSPYEPPQDPDLILETPSETIAESAAKLLEFVEERIKLPS
jgi:bifunctional enzyme CysN/CysC